MKKHQQGTPGYLDYKKKMEILRTIVYFAIVAAVFFLGYSQTHTRKNVLTIIAILGCLPASKALVGVITRFPYRSIAPSVAKEIREKSSHLSVIYDLVVTSTEKIMPIDCIVVSGNTIFGYTSSSKVDLKYAAGHIKEILQKNQFSDVSVKLLNQYNPFLARVEGLNNIAAVEQNDTKEYEQMICHVIKNISL